jgi:hypothetical protein
MLIGGQKGGGLHHLRTEVILTNDTTHKTSPGQVAVDDLGLGL